MIERETLPRLPYSYSCKGKGYVTDFALSALKMESGIGDT